MRIPSLPSNLYKSSMANICQRDARSEFLRVDGEALCGPVSVADILIHLAKTHCPFLIEAQGKLSEHEAWFKLIDQLATYMKTDEDGTTEEDLIEGFKRYVKDRDSSYKVTTFAQSYYAEEEGSILEVISDPRKIIPHIIGPSNTLLGVSFAEYIPNLDSYNLILSHYVALAGFINNGSSCRFIIHDPSPGAKREPTICDLTPIKKGTLNGWCLNEKLDATDFNQLHGLAIDKPEKDAGANRVILDGMVSFAVERK